MIRIIFFDFDGVIVESTDIKTDAFAKLFEQKGSDVREKVVNYHLKNMGVSRYEKFRFIYQNILRRSLDEQEFDLLCSRFANLVVDGVINAPYVRGVMEFLGIYAAAYSCFVVSATPQEEIEYIIQKRNIHRFFKAIYGSPTRKSDAVRNIIIEEGIEPCNAVYIGDAMSDYWAAKDNGVNFIARINHNEALFNDVECFKVKDLTGLRTIIERL